MASRRSETFARAGSFGPVERRPRGVTDAEAVVWVVAVAALVADVALTTRGLALGATELNPVGRWTIDAVGPVVAMGLLKLAAVATAVVGRELVPPASRWVVPACLAVPWTLAAAANAAVVLALA